MKTDEQAHLLDKLQDLLEEQIEMALRSDFQRVEELVEQAGFIINKIVKTRCFERPEFDDQWERLTKLYKKLELMLTADKDSTANQLRQVGNVLKTLDVYHNKGGFQLSI